MLLIRIPCWTRNLMFIARICMHVYTHISVKPALLHSGVQILPDCLQGVLCDRGRRLLCGHGRHLRSVAAVWRLVRFDRRAASVLRSLLWRDGSRLCARGHRAHGQQYRCELNFGRFEFFHCCMFRVFVRIDGQYLLYALENLNAAIAQVTTRRRAFPASRSPPTCAHCATTSSRASRGRASPRCRRRKRCSSSAAGTSFTSPVSGL
jgi:hypothetical protein